MNSDDCDWFSDSLGPYLTHFDWFYDNLGLNLTSVCVCVCVGSDEKDVKLDAVVFM